MKVWDTSGLFAYSYTSGFINISDSRFRSYFIEGIRSDHFVGAHRVFIQKNAFGLPTVYTHRVADDGDSKENNRVKTQKVLKVKRQILHM